MTSSDTSERGLERLICTALTGAPCDPASTSGKGFHERPATYGAGWTCGVPGDYDREHCVDLVQLAAFLQETQPEAARRSTSARTGRRGASSWHGCRARSASAAPSTCCATASSTGRITSICSTARRHRATPRPRSGTPPIASASPASSATAATRRSARSTSACSSTGCRSPPSS